MKQMKRWKWGSIALTIVGMALGVCLMIWPDLGAQVLCLVVGAALLLAGVMHIVSYFQRGISALWHRYELPLGLLDALLGVYFFSKPGNVMLLVPVIVGIAILVDSVCKLQTALELRQVGVRRWWLLLALSVACILAAAFLLRNPFEGTRTLVTCLGITLVIDGAQGLVFIHNAARDVRRLLPIEAEFVEAE